MHEPFNVVHTSWKKRTCSNFDPTVYPFLVDRLSQRETVAQGNMDKNNCFFVNLLLKLFLSMFAGFQEKTRHGTQLVPSAVVAGVLSCCLHVGGNIFFYKSAVACGA